MKRITLFLVFLLPFSGISAQEILVEYDCSVMPSAASPPWDVIGQGNYELSTESDILRIYNHDNLAWVLLERVELAFNDVAHIVDEAVVKVPSNNNINASRQISLSSYDPERPYYNRAHLWYAVDLYPDRIEFTRIGLPTV